MSITRKDAEDIWIEILIRGTMCTSGVIQFPITVIKDMLNSLVEDGRSPLTVTVCDKCAHSKGTFPDLRIKCRAPLAPITDFTDGSKTRDVINTDGKCKYYEAKRPENPIPDQIFYGKGMPPAPDTIRKSY